MFTVYPLGDSGIKIDFGNEISPQKNRSIHAYGKKLKEDIKEIIEVVPTYNSLSLFFLPQKGKYDEIVSNVHGVLKDPLVVEETVQSEIIFLPTLYGGDVGTDLDRIAEVNQITIEDVIKIHSERDYFIYMMGFLPGFPYLGGMSKKISAPRLEEPRLKVAAGSVGIANEQTGLYPIESPGGWNIIGRMPVPLFNPQSNEPFLLKAGSYIRFIPVGEDEYSQIQHEIEKGTYIVEREVYIDGKTN